LHILLTPIGAASKEEATHDAQPVWLIQPHAQIGMTGEVAHLTGPFVGNYLAPALLEHRQFINSLSAHPFSDVSNVRRAQQTSFKPTLTGAETEFDYIAEARREAEELTEMLKRREPGPELDNSINNILDRVDKRVAQRRKRAGRPASRPQGWRKRAMHLIRQDLDLHR
jgi:hypothetical protein